MWNQASAATTEAEIYDRIATILVQALAVDEAAVVPSARLEADLGAESIDFLDILFRLERSFGIVIPRGDLFPDSIFGGHPDYVQDGRVTELGVAELRRRLHFADLDSISDGLGVECLGDIFTVGLIASYVAYRLIPDAVHVCELQVA